MTSQTSTLPQSAPARGESDFQSTQVATLTGGHFIHDVYSAFLAPLLPALIEKLSISLTQAGGLSAIMQVPSLLNPFIGYLDDKVNLRLLVIFAPAITATLMSGMGLAPNYLVLVVLLFVTGLSIAAFHATAPSIVARTSGRQIGKGMSFFMAGGELGRTIGPLVAVWALSTWALEGMARVAILGWAASLVILLRFRGVTAHPQRQSGFRAVLPVARRLFVPLFIIVFARSLLVIGLGVYLPTFMRGAGSSLWVAGSALAIYQFAGVGGALAGGTLSDRFGRKPVLFLATVLSPLFVILFLHTSNWLLVPVLLVLGFISLSAQPIMMALVQDQLPDHRSVANGFYMAMSFALQSISAIVIGMLGDRIGLSQAFFWTAIVSLLVSPVIWLLPGHLAIKKTQQ